jgi:hypothetical protein
VRYRLRLAVAASQANTDRGVAALSRTTRPFQQRLLAVAEHHCPTRLVPKPGGPAGLGGRLRPLGLDPTGHAGYY